MEHLGDHMLAALARGIGLDETIFRDLFENGISTLRLLHHRPSDLNRTASVGADVP